MLDVTLPETDDAALKVQTSLSLERTGHRNAIRAVSVSPDDALIMSTFFELKSLHRGVILFEMQSLVEVLVTDGIAPNRYGSREHQGVECEVTALREDDPLGIRSLRLFHSRQHALCSRNEGRRFGAVLFSFVIHLVVLIS